LREKKLKETYEELFKEIKFEENKNSSHDFEHMLRVYNMCKLFGETLRADMNVLLPAAILHDVARDEKNHAKESAVKAKGILLKYNFREETIERITEAISTHSYSSGVLPKTLEGKILSDADKLDALGSIGIFRAATYSQEVGRSLNDFINHFYDKLLKLDELLYTEKAKEIGKKRKDFMVLFLNQLKDELNQIH
jgi:uncharacterized protein